LSTVFVIHGVGARTASKKLSRGLDKFLF